MKHLLCLLMLTAAADWPRFRGPNGDGRGEAAGVPVPWTTNDYRWVVTLPGVGHSSPVVVGSRLFVTCGENSNATRIVVCLDALNGKKLWQREFASQSFQQNGDNSYASATPGADSNGVVVSWSTPEQVTLVAFDNEGRDLWQRELGKFVGIHGSGSSPIIVDDLVIFFNDQEDPASLPARVYAKPGAPKTAGKSALVAFDRLTGKTRWQLDRQSNQSAYSTPCVRRAANGRAEIILADTAHSFTAVDAATGKVSWMLPDLFKERCVASPVLAGDLVLATEGRGSTGIRCVAVRSGNPPSCARVATGVVLWQEQLSGNFYSSPVAADGRLFWITKLGDVLVFADADKYELLARVPLGEKCFATPAIANGLIYVRTYSRIFALGARKLIRDI
ncbi:MAG: PQQ-binding-like beta-propeller repeat protein [Kiritimatiellaeota bacterium]|nr:PQQ-binding-like beta-propeller repeat protein [Kiritimatiellota bacterium]